MVSAITYLSRKIGFWRFPVHSDGLYEHMTYYDKLRYIVKCQDPICVAERGSGIESWLRERRPPLRTALPAEFIEEGALTLSAAGDLMPNALLPRDSTALYGGIEPILFASDLSFANLEAPIHDSPVPFALSSQAAPPLSMSQQQFQVICRCGKRHFDIMATACNHSLDFGMEGVQATCAALQEQGICRVGTNLTLEEQCTGTIVERCGVRIGFVAATFGLNGYRPPVGWEHVVNVVPFNGPLHDNALELLTKQMAALRRAGCDLIVASAHWGKEYEFWPTNGQMQMAHALVEMGADIVFGHHPHVIAPAEAYTPKRNPDQTALICYSLGNLINPFTAPFLALSLCAKIRISIGRIRSIRSLRISAIELVPVLQVIHSGDCGAHIRLHSLRDALKMDALTKEQHIEAQAAAHYADLVLGSDWRKRPLMHDAPLFEGFAQRSGPC